MHKNWAEDIALIRDMEFEVDDNKEPGLENVPLLLNAPARINGGICLKGKSGGGMALIAKQLCKA